MMLERGKPGQHRRAMHDRIELAKLRIDRGGRGVELVGRRARKVEWQHRGFCGTAGDNRVVKSLELADDATVQRNRRTVRGDPVRERLAESAGRPRNEDDLAGERFQLSDFAVYRCDSGD